MSDKKNELRLITKTHSSYSIVSFILAMVSLLLFIIAVILSAFYHLGTTGDMIKVGLFATIGMMANFSGIIFGIIGEVIKDHFKTFSHIGLVVHGVMFVLNMYILAFGY